MNETLVVAQPEKNRPPIDVDMIQALESFPQLKELPPAEAQIIVLYAAGMLPAGIASYLGLHINTVNTVLEKSKIAEIIAKGVEIQKLLLANQIGGIMVAALAELKKKTREFKDMPVASLIKLIESCHAIQEKVKVKAIQTNDEKAHIKQLSS